MAVTYPSDPSLGNVEADFFEPWKWKTEYPQPAFDAMDAADAFWGASIASRFSDPMIRAIVNEGRLSDEGSARFLADVIIRRRDKVVRYWITRTNPLDRFEVRRVESGLEVTFDNAAQRVGAARPDATYTIRWSALDNARRAEEPRTGPSTTKEPRALVADAAWGPRDGAGDRYAIATIATHHPDFAGWKAPVTVTLRDRSGSIDVVGIVRPAQGESVARQ